MRLKSSSGRSAPASWSSWTRPAWPVPSLWTNSLAAAEQAGAKLLLVGDPYQLTSVDAGGMFRSLARDRADLAPELTDVRRFKAGWEKVASAELRVGNEHAIDAYLAHGRVGEGPRDELVDRVYCAWRGDVEKGMSSLMVASDSATAAELNRRARAHRIAIGEVVADGLEVAGGATAGIGREDVGRADWCIHHLLSGGGYGQLCLGLALITG